MKKALLSCIIALFAINIYAADDGKYTEPAGAFYTPYLFPNGANAGAHVPQMIMPAMSSYTFTSATAGDWTMGEQGAKGTTSFSPEYAFGTYSGNVIPTFNDGTEDYTYGAGSTSGSARQVYVASTTEKWMTNAKYYAPGTSGQAVVLKMKGTYIKYRVFFYNNPGQVMKVSELCIPITTNGNGTTKADLFPEGASMTVAIYDATCTRTADGKYTNTKGSTKLLAPVTLTAENYLPNNTKEYTGVLHYALEKPILVTGAFVIEISDFDTMGDETRIYEDNCTGTTSKGLKYKDESKTTLSVASMTHNFLVAVKGMFYSILPDGAVNTLEYEADGGDQTVGLYTNGSLSAKSITKPDWVNCEISYESDKQYVNRKNFIKIIVDPNNGAERIGEVVINNNGMKLVYSIKQSSGASAANTILSAGKYEISATITPGDGVVVPTELQKYLEGYTAQCELTGDENELVISTAEEGFVLNGYSVKGDALQLTDAMELTYGEKVFKLADAEGNTNGSLAVTKTGENTYALADATIIYRGMNVGTVTGITFKLVEDTPTGINEKAIKTNKVVKVLNDGKVVIIRNGLKYGIAGF